MKNTQYAYIAGKKFDSDKLGLILRYPVQNKIEKIDIKMEDKRYETISKLPLETLIHLKDEDVHIIAESDISNRTGKGDFQKGTIRDYISDEDQADRHLLLREPLYFSIQKLRNALHKDLTNYFTDKGLTWVAPSILTKATEACEDISGLFWTDYQNKDTGLDEKIALAQTAQLHLEAMCPAYGHIYSIAPSFRREKGQPTIKHLLEYWHVEAELVDIPLDELMIFTEDMLKHAINSSLKNHQIEIEVIKDALGIDKEYFEKLLKPYEKITYDQALERLNNEGYTCQQTGQPIKWGDDFDSKAEKIISTEMPVFVYNWPDRLKAFYFTRFKQNGTIYAKSFDLIGLHHGEIAGGGERESRIEQFKYLLDRQVEAIKAHGHDPKDYKYYEDLRMIGSIPHSGFGMGLERALAFLYNLKDVRMASLFPRDQRRVYP